MPDSVKRLANGFIPYEYTPVWKEIEYRTETQNHNYGGRLNQGRTFKIGENETQEFFVTHYDDQSVEYWMIQANRTGRHSKTLAILTEYEMGRLLETMLIQQKVVMVKS